MEYIEKYLNLNFSIIPVNSIEKKGSLIRSWKKYQNERASIEVITNWYEQFGANIGLGIVTGKISDIIVLDVDPRNGGQESLKGKHIPKTITVRTGGNGTHYYYRYPKNMKVKNMIGFLPGLDLRGDGGLVYAPPSLHPSDNNYAFYDFLGPDDIDIAEIPKWLLEIITKKNKEGKVNKNIDWDNLYEGVREGQRNITCTKLTGKLINAKVPYGIIISTLKDWNQKNTPPLSEKELLKTINSIYDLSQKKSKNSIKNNFKNNSSKQNCSKLIEENFCYFINKSKEKIKLSNFIINQKERLILEETKEQIIIADIVLENDVISNVEIKNSDLINKNSLLRSLGTVKTCWYGTERDIQILREYLSLKKLPEKKATKILGKHGNAIILPNISLNKNGLTQNAKNKLLVNKNNLWDSLPQKLVSKEEHRDVCKKVYKLLPLINQGNIISPIISWVFSLPFANEIRKNGAWGGFPLLVINGIHGSGKTSTIQEVLRLCGLKINPLELPLTRFTRLRHLSSSNLIPTWFDEYRPGRFSKNISLDLHHEFRIAYNAQNSYRGNVDQSMTRYPLVAPIVISGEDRVRDNAIDERIIPITFKKKNIDFESVCYISFQEFVKIKLEQFAYNYWIWCLNQENWLDRLEKKFNNLKIKNIPIRVKKNLSIISFGWELFNDYANFLDIEVSSLIKYNFRESINLLKDEIISQKSTKDKLDELMVVIANMVSDQIIDGNYMTKYKNNKIVIRVKHIVETKLHRYIQETGNKLDLELSSQAYQNLINEKFDNNNSYIKNKSVLGTFFGKKYRGVVIDPYELEKQLGIDVSIWGFNRKKDL
ncbi:MAG: bifunctional DNA primase/polymerase [bacterium]